MFQQRFRGSVHGDLESICGVETRFGFRRFGEEALGENRERVGATNGLRKRLMLCIVSLTPAAHEPVHRAIERLDQHRTLIGRQAALEHQRTVVIGAARERAMPIRVERRFRIAQAFGLAHRRHIARDMRRRIRARHLDELCLVLHLHR